MEKSNIITVSVNGFNRPFSSQFLGLRLNTSPSLDIWVNSKEEYHAYKTYIGKKDKDGNPVLADFTPRMITTRAGKQKKVYDLNVVDIADEELDTLFDRSYEAASETTEEKPF